MPLIETEAVVLNTLKLGEADKLVTFYTRNFGKVKAVAKGARKLKNKFGSSLEPFSRSHLVVYDKNSRFLYRLFQSDMIESFQKLRSDYEKILYTSRFLTCLEALTPEGDPSPLIYDLLLKFLDSLKGERIGARSIHLYKLKLLGYSGYEFSLDRCLKCQNSGTENRLSPLAGGMICSACALSDPSRSFPVSQPALAVLRQTFKMGHDLIPRIKPSGEVILEIAHILDVFIFHLLGKKLPSI